MTPHSFQLMRKQLLHGGAALLVLLLCATAGCKPLAEAATAKPVAVSGDTVSVSTDSVNYMYDRGLKYTLYDLSQTPPAAIGGAIVYMLGTGGGKGCCIALPTVWHPGTRCVSTGMRRIATRFFQANIHASLKYRITTNRLICMWCFIRSRKWSWWFPSASRGIRIGVVG